jgi:hypothetical protein
VDFIRELCEIPYFDSRFSIKVMCGEPNGNKRAGKSTEARSGNQRSEPEGWSW